MISVLFTTITYILHRFKMILYLDCDVIVNYGVSSLFETDISGYLVAAARDTHVVGRVMAIPPHEMADYCRTTLSLAHPENYFQCGVLLFNVPEIIATYPNGGLIIEAVARKLKWLDQDLLNVLFANRVKILSNRWKVMVFNNEEIDEYNLEGEIHLDYFTARENPRIVHYVGRSIPCYRPKIDMNWYFWPYARRTPFYELFLSRMMDEKVRLHNTEHVKQRGKSSIKSIVKLHIIRPLLNILLPYSTHRYYVVKRFYYILRGWKFSEKRVRSPKK